MKWIDLLFAVFSAIFNNAAMTEFLLFSTVLLLATVAAYIARRTGVFHLALDGTVVLSACVSYVFSELAAHFMGDQPSFWSAAAGMVMGIAAGLLFTAIVGWFIIRAGNNDVLVGVIANYFARHFSLLVVGITAGIFGSITLTKLPVVHLAALEGIPMIGSALASTSSMTWVAAVLPVAAFLLLNRTTIGLQLRASEENPAALINAGVEVSKVRMRGLLISGAVASLAGVACALGVVPTRAQATVPESFGYLALVLVFAAGGRLSKSCGFAVLFGFLGALPAMLVDVPIAPALVRSVVYLAALLLMMLHVYRH
ncbi:MAG: hypothetical protein RSF90_04110, partial [Pygmaiobacter sp.]